MFTFTRNSLSADEIADCMSYRISDMQEIFKYYMKKERYIEYVNTGSDKIKLEKYYRKLRGIGIIDEEIFRDKPVPYWVLNKFKFDADVVETKTETFVDADVVSEPDCSDGENKDFSGEDCYEVSKLCDDLEANITIIDAISADEEDNSIDYNTVDVPKYELDGSLTIVASGHKDQIELDRKDYNIPDCVTDTALLLCGKLRRTGAVSPDMYKDGDIRISREAVCSLNNDNITFNGDEVIFESIVKNMKRIEYNTRIIFSLRYSGKLYYTFRLSNGLTFAFDECEIYPLPFDTEFYVYRYKDKWYQFGEKNHDKNGDNVIYMDVLGEWYFSTDVVAYVPQKLTLNHNLDWLKVFTTISTYCNKGQFNFVEYCLRYEVDRYDVITINCILSVFGIFKMRDNYHYRELAYPVRCEKKVQRILSEMRHLLGDKFTYNIPFQIIRNLNDNNKDNNIKKSGNQTKRRNRRRRARVTPFVRNDDFDILKRKNDYKAKKKKDNNGSIMYAGANCDDKRHNGK